MRFARRWGSAAAATLATVGFAPVVADAGAQVKAGTTTGDAERVDTIPISPRPGTEPRVAISLPPHRMPDLRRGDRLRALGEVQVTNTCVLAEARCIGRRYSFDPRVKAWLVIGRSSTATHGPSATRISRRESVECGQHRPNRNHHCVLTLPTGGITVGSPERLPCPPVRCRVNLVVSADHPSATHRHRLVIGADTPSGDIKQGKGRVSALVVRAGSHARTRRVVSKRRVHRRIQMDRSGGWTSVYSVKLPHPKAGDVIVARARQILDIGHLGNAVFDSSQIILAQGRQEAESGRIARRSGTPQTFTEKNGFNCTQGPSAYRTPCLSRKAGLLTIERTPVDRQGREVPLYVNLITRGFLKTAQPKRALSAHILRGGSLRVTQTSAIAPESAGPEDPRQDSS